MRKLYEITLPDGYVSIMTGKELLEFHDHLTVELNKNYDAITYGVQEEEDKQ